MARTIDRATLGPGNKKEPWNRVQTRTILVLRRCKCCQPSERHHGIQKGENRFCFHRQASGCLECKGMTDVAYSIRGVVAACKANLNRPEQEHILDAALNFTQ